MSCPDNSQTTFVLKLIPPFCFCQGCVEDAEKFVLKIKGVHSVKVSKEKGVATISGKVPAHRVIEELIEMFDKKKRKKIEAELVVKENDQSKVSEQKVRIGLSQNHGQKSLTVSQQLPEQGKATGEAKSLSKVNKQNLKTISTQNHRSRSHRVSPQPPDLSIKAIDKPKANTIRNGHPKHKNKMELKSHTKSFKCDICKHKMELKSHAKPFKCDGCKEDGFGKRYRCESCDHDFHELCMSREPNIIHEHFNRCTLEFSQDPGYICDACGLKIHGYSYSNEKDKLDLHPCCSKLEGKLSIGDIDFVLRKKVEGKCFWCQKKQPSCVENHKFPGWCYVSKQYKFKCHVYCISEMVQEAWKKGQLDHKDKVDDDFMALEKLDLEKLDLTLGPSRERSGRTFKVVVALLKMVISTLLGDPISLISLAVELFT